MNAYNKFWVYEYRIRARGDNGTSTYGAWT